MILRRSVGTWFAAFLFASLSPAQAANREAVQIGWLGGAASPVPAGVSWGVPWPKGTVAQEQIFSLMTADGKVLPVQTWPLAYWPDGSLKWSGFATVAGSANPGPFKLAPSDTAAASSPADGPRVTVRRTDTTIEIDTGRVRVRIPKWGANLIDSISIDGREVARAGQLVCILQTGPDGGYADVLPRERYGTKLESAALEQSGPVRAVIRLEGKHRGGRTSREWLPFVVRLYFYAGQENVRLVHSIVYDGDEQKDFIRGLGLVFAVPMREELQNRHIRFSGDGAGLWAEPVQPMIGRGGRFVAAPGGGDDVYPNQVDGKRVPNRSELNPRGQNLLADWAVWDAVKLSQPNAGGFTVMKRTNAESAWIPAGAGKRASGFVFAGDVSGGLGVSVKNFWQSYPSALEVQKAGTGAAELTVWLWSPDAPAMDMRHYDTRPHGLESVYEDVQPGFSTAHGVGRTSELTLFPTVEVPTRETTVALAQIGAQPPVLVCTPQYYQSAQAFGTWGLQDRSTPVKQAIEDRLDATLNFYLKQPDQHNWYGFWDFGDVMHSYDNERHVWRYDLGGMAWANSELGPDMWLWLSFLRSGRADVFRMAEAMTRHTGEVDVYHLGRFAGLGSRHNVRHWGCGAKEARISQAAYRRYYHYLTTDERVGDLMREVVNADFKTVEFDPMRLAQPITEAEKKIAPTRVRLGPDWFAFLGNWMTEWERTRDPKWRDKILAGVESLNAMPLGLRSGKNLVYGYDPATGKLSQLSDDLGLYNLATIMGGAEVVFELNLMLDDPRWQKLWLQYCRLYSAPRETVLRDMTTGAEGADGAFVRDGRLSAYVFQQTKNAAFSKPAIDSLLWTARGGRRPGGSAVRRIEGPESLNPTDEGLGGTNGAAQSGLEAIAMLGFVGDLLPAEIPPLTAEETARMRGGRQGQGQGQGRGARPQPTAPAETESEKEP
ncbi:MAG TPA: Tat pathway signal sequence domain protein [Opitutaceae bacterium]|nr:Tat pathway signal sequence domain protein [Opitutaceae bacterium]